MEKYFRAQKVKWDRKETSNIPQSGCCFEEDTMDNFSSWRSMPQNDRMDRSSRLAEIDRLLDSQPKDLDSGIQFLSLLYGQSSQQPRPVARSENPAFNFWWSQPQSGVRVSPSLEPRVTSNLSFPAESSFQEQHFGNVKKSTERGMEVEDSGKISEGNQQAEEQAPAEKAPAETLEKPAETLEKRYENTEGSQRGRKRNPPKTMRSGKKKVKQVVILDEDDDDDPNSKVPWTDEQTRTLISLKQEMEPEFKAASGKQGVNSWIKLQKKMVVSCRNFTKSAEACKKKYLAEFSKYKKDKLHNVVSGNDRKITCKFYDELDLHSGNSIHVKKAIHADASGSDNPCPVEDDSFLDKSPERTENPENVEYSSSKVTSGVEGPTSKSRPKDKTTTVKQGQERMFSILENLVDAVADIGNKIEKNGSRLDSWDMPSLTSQLIGAVQGKNNSAGS